MDKELLEILKEMRNDIKELKNGQDRMEKKLDSVIEQTADLTEFRTETKDKLNSIENTVKDTQKDLATIEIVTARNMENIAHLKAIR